MNAIVFFGILASACSFVIVATLLYLYDYLWVRWVTNTAVDKGVFELLYERTHLGVLPEGLMTDFDCAAEALMLLVLTAAILLVLLLLAIALAAVGILPLVVGVGVFFVGAKVYYSKYKA